MCMTIRGHIFQTSFSAKKLFCTALILDLNFFSAIVFSRNNVLIVQYVSSLFYKAVLELQKKKYTKCRARTVAITRILNYIIRMPENRKIKIKDETDKTLYEVKLDNPSENKKMNPVLKVCLLILAIPAGFAIGYLLFKYF